MECNIRYTVNIYIYMKIIIIKNKQTETETNDARYGSNFVTFSNKKNGFLYEPFVSRRLLRGYFGSWATL